MNRLNLYLPVILWALHQGLGTDRGNKAYAALCAFIAANPPAQ